MEQNATILRTMTPVFSARRLLAGLLSVLYLKEEGIGFEYVAQLLKLM